MKLRNSALFVAAGLVLNGCAAPRQTGAGGQAPDLYYATGSARVCDEAALYIVGLSTCRAKTKGMDRVHSIAVCGAAEVSACYLDSRYKAEQVRTAQQVADEYMQRYGRLPEKALATLYRSEVSPRVAASLGQQVNLTSTIVVVPGRSEPAVMIEQELAIVDGTGAIWGHSQRKEVNPGILAGEFKTSFSLPVSKYWSQAQGMYTLRMTLYVNRVVARRDDSSARIQIVQ